MTEFECTRCGVCCRWGGYVYITEDDVKGMSAYLALSEHDFVNTYADIVYRPRLNLKTKEDGRCIFQEGNDCSMHSAKPKQCVGFPAIWRIKNLESFCNGQKGIKLEDTERSQ